MERVETASMQVLRGPKGDKGDPGEPLNILGVLPDVASLPPYPDPGDAYLIGDDVHLYTEADGWLNRGLLRGPDGPAGPRGLQGLPGHALAIIDTVEPPVADVGEVWYDPTAVGWSSVVVTGETEPVNPEVGLMWINPSAVSDTSIVAISGTEPLNPDAGLIWLDPNGGV